MIVLQSEYVRWWGGRGYEWLNYWWRNILTTHVLLNQSGGVSYKWQIGLQTHISQDLWNYGKRCKQVHFLVLVDEESQCQVICYQHQFKTIKKTFWRNQTLFSWGERSLLIHSDNVEQAMSALKPSVSQLGGTLNPDLGANVYTCTKRW